MSGYQTYWTSLPFNMFRMSLRLRFTERKLRYFKTNFLNRVRFIEAERNIK